MYNDFMNASPTFSSRLPVLFVSHGSPMFAVEHGATAGILRKWGQSLSVRPRGIVMMSPHWMARNVQVMTNPAPQTWHDFGGFPEILYTLQYPAKGDPALGAHVIALLNAAGIQAQADAKRPFDHGAWVPLMHLFPDADIPVVQVALPVNYTPAGLFAMGAALASLRDEGILIIGSGSMTHNLGEFFGDRPVLGAPTEPYVEAFSRWIEQGITTGDRTSMFNYRSLAPHAERAHPTDEHFVPLYFSLGAGGWGTATAPSTHYLSREVMYSILAMDSFSVE